MYLYTDPSRPISVAVYVIWVVLSYKYYIDTSRYVHAVVIRLQYLPQPGLGSSITVRGVQIKYRSTINPEGSGISRHVCCRLGSVSL